MSLTLKFPMSHVTKPKNAHVAVSNLVVHTHTNGNISQAHLSHVKMSCRAWTVTEIPRNRIHVMITNSLFPEIHLMVAMETGL